MVLIYNIVNTKHQKTLKAIFAVPVQSSISWNDVETLLLALGAELTEGNGSRIRIALKGCRAVFHRPHPQKEIDKGAVIALRRFLLEVEKKLC